MTSLIDYFNNPIKDIINNIHLKKIEQYNQSSIIPLYYSNPQSSENISKEKKPLLIKTPKLFLPFKPTLYSYPDKTKLNKNKTDEFRRGLIKLSFDNQANDPNIDLFISLIKGLEKLRKKIPEGIIEKKHKFKRMIQTNPPYPDYININFDLDQLKVYDSNLKKIDIMDVKPRFYAYFIIHITGFYISQKGKYGLSCNLIQFKLDKLKVDYELCFFLDESEEKIELKDSPILEKFFKMLSLGIPKQAVKQKMILSNINPEFIDYTTYHSLPNNLKNIYDDFMDYTYDNQNININNNNNNVIESNGGIPPPPPPPLMDLKSVNPSKLITGSLLSAGISRLKKVEKPLEKVKKKYKDPRVPSLEDIKNAIGQLKSIKESDKSDF